MFQDGTPQSSLCDRHSRRSSAAICSVQRSCPRPVGTLFYQRIDRLSTRFGGFVLGFASAICRVLSRSPAIGILPFGKVNACRQSIREASTRNEAVQPRPSTSCRLQISNVEESFQPRWVFLGSGVMGASIGLTLVLLAGNGPWNHSTARRILWNACYPLMWAADRLLGLFFTHNRIAPSITQVYLFDCLFVTFCGLVLGAICSTVAAALAFTCRRFAPAPRSGP